jgi:mono/diheme cytochrome c family protein
MMERSELSDFDLQPKAATMPIWRCGSLALTVLVSIWIAPVCLCAGAESSKAGAEGLAFFESKIRPLLVEHCYECHSAGAKKVKGSLVLDTRDGWQKGGESGKPTVVPGKPEESLLIRAVRHVDEDLAMPPKKKLPSAAIADLVAWVKMGAPDPRDGKTETKRADKSWWSLQPLAQTNPPDLPHPKYQAHLWTGNPIDRFVLAKLLDKDLLPNPPADPRTLIRRMSYDVTGLPPTPEEVEAFVQSVNRNRQSAIEALVDRLLASPHYGERWGRHWLDVVRFGESVGFEKNGLIDDLWLFRDYVIRSFNQDKPFNQFITEHLAGDVVGRNNPDVEIGTAFLVAGPYDDVGNMDPVARANIRAATLDDPIAATGAAFLGLSINCARCHHHKFDPIPTEDYYRLRAAFEGVTHGRRVIATTEEREQFKAATKPLNERRGRLTAEKSGIEEALEKRAKEEAAKKTYPRPKPSPALTEERFTAVEARFVKFVMLADTGDARRNPVTSRALTSPRLDEFEVWSASEPSRNVAFAGHGGIAEGASGRQADDFDGAYDVRLVNDGKFGSCWFPAAPYELTITLPRPERIDRVTISHTRGSTVLSGRGAFVCEYEILASMDGKNWQSVASANDREPWSPAHGVERARREITTPEERERLAGLVRDIAALDKQLAAVPRLREAWAGHFVQPKEATVVHKGGDPMKPGEAVVAASLNVLDRVTRAYELAADAPEGERRLALAKWIASDDNPLTARVLANRVWHYHFGTGLVDTPSDFGFLGSRPTHPDLLDWLARRLVQHGWQLKALHRDILLSQTYLQSAAFRDDGATADRDARLLWRFPPRRLGAEEIRETLLMVAGKLDLRMGGPGFRLYRYMVDNVSTYFPLDHVGPETYRRTVYHQGARAAGVDLLSDFDLPDNAFPVPKRGNTTTPLQALTLLNHSFTLDMAAALAGRLEKEAGKEDIAAQVNRAHALAFQRAPTRKEREAAVNFIRQISLRAYCRALLNSNDLIYCE